MTRIYALFASVKGYDPSPWMIACEDEFTWEGNPERCDALFKQKRAEAERDGNEVREMVIDVDYEKVAAAFLPSEIGSEVFPNP